jgi:uncharacterized protein with PIN domain
VKFLVDSMCGGLARWLRILGQDAEYERDADDGELAARALREGRVLLTRDRRLLERKAARGGHLVRGEGTMEELLDVVRAFGLPVAEGEGRLFSRCLECNRELEEVPKGSVEEEVPPYVFRTQESFKRCPGCRRIYWAATHREHVLARLAGLLEAGREGDAPGTGAEAARNPGESGPSGGDPGGPPGRA